MGTNVLLAALETQAHVWTARTDAIASERLRAAGKHMLNTEELARYERFHSDVARHDYLAAHALLRSSLSRYAAVDPADWAFAAGPYGKPALYNDPALPPLCFNLSHTRNLVACVITLDCGCGVDVEIVNPSRNIHSIARMVFTDSEIAGLGLCSESEAVERFFRIWTLKEAFAKATGEGFSAELQRITFDRIEETAPALHRDCVTVPAPCEWTFLSSTPTPLHRLAVAVQARREVVCTDITLQLADLGFAFR
ncbi:MAG: 4'-phosphopantetheinyl transferase superfamily protein [Nevskia sp.]|nr:4'-phosphopantetheinyl transferase superfamily protein [Nevskia sp.]